jgi:hypothetical protein
MIAIARAIAGIIVPIAAAKTETVATAVVIVSMAVIVTVIVQGIVTANAIVSIAVNVTAKKRLPLPWSKHPLLISRVRLLQAAAR